MYYFASDVHLGAGGEQWTRHTEQRFVRWLDMVASDADGIFLLGDIFDFWWEYRKVVPKGFVRTFGKLAELTDQGIKITFITGNHDMWAKDYLQKECGVETLFTPQRISLYGKELFVAHGDNMNIKGQPMLRAMNAFFRSRTARWLFRWLVHPDVAMKFGLWWSGKSRKSHGGEQITSDRLDYLVEYARNYHAEHTDVCRYIFGHMHLAHRVTDGDVDVLFLSDWSGDKATYATLDEDNNLELKTFDIDETISRASR